MTANSNTVSRGSRFWKSSSSTTPAAAPRPSAVINTPKVALSPPSASFANTGPSGIIAPPPISPRPRPTITPRTRGSLTMNCRPSLMSRNVSERSAWCSGPRSGPRMGRRQTISAETTNDAASTRSASTSWSTLRSRSAWNDPSHAASAARSEKMIDANGNVPYDATSDSVFADASCSGSTRLGTDASLAGPHSSVRTSSANENTTSQPRLSTSGSSASSVARPTSHHTITLPAVEPVDDDPADRPEEEAGHDARHHDEADRRARVVRHPRRDRRGSR